MQLVVLTLYIWNWYLPSICITLFNLNLQYTEYTLSRWQRPQLSNRKIYLCLYKTFAAINSKEFWNVDDTNDILNAYQGLNVLLWMEISIYLGSGASLRPKDCRTVSTLLWTCPKGLNFLPTRTSLCLTDKWSGWSKRAVHAQALMEMCILNISIGTLSYDSTSLAYILEFLYTLHFSPFFNLVFLHLYIVYNFITHQQLAFLFIYLFF